MAALKDVERGVSDGGSSQPLLSTNSNETERRRPPRPTDITSNLRHNVRPPPLQLLETPSSTMSTPSNTPATASEWPRKWRRSDRRLRRLNTELLEAIENHEFEEIERLLNAGANPNATCRLSLASACHFAALMGGDALSLILKFGAEKFRLDRLGRTPLHLAAWAANIRQVAILLDFPEDMQLKVDADILSVDVEEDIKRFNAKTREIVNSPCRLDLVKLDIQSNWKDNIDHNCREIEGTLPVIKEGWTALHIATAVGRLICTRLLLAAGADPNLADNEGRTPLDVTGTAHYYGVNVDLKKFTEVIRLLLKAGGKFNSMKLNGVDKIPTPLHVAVELECVEALNELLAAGVSVGCLNNEGLTPLHLCVAKKFEMPLQVLANHVHTTADPFSATVDVKDGKGHTVLTASVEKMWVPGVCIALEAGADVTLKATDGGTPLHSAATLGNLDVLTEVLSIAKQKDSIDVKNNEGETPLFLAIQSGHIECVKAILSEGASIKITLPGEVNVFHVAAENGHLDILKELCNFDEASTKSMINALTARDRRGFGAIHFAVLGNHADCVEFMLTSFADIRLRTTDSPHKSSTPLHIAAVKNHKEVAEMILKHDKTTIHEVNGMGWFPLHSAGHHGSRDVIVLLLQEGADLSSYTDGVKKYRKSAIDMIIHNMSKPKDFLEEVFDSYISTNCQRTLDPNCEITVDYRVLMPTSCEMAQMKVIEALLKTGNRYGQENLLVHPLLESFLHLKWKALLPFFYTIMALYGMFVFSLTVFIVSVFFYKDTKENPPIWLNSTVWGYMVYVTISLIIVQEMLYMNVKTSRYLLQLETWVKFGSIGLAIILPPTVMIVTWAESEWPRHVATLAVLLSWLEMMFLLSRFPNWGYYVLMFGKVASNVVKILLTFAFLVVGFSLSFMIQFHSQVPFEGPWAALVKTMVMMTSEFDYVSMFDKDHIADLSTSILVVRLIFVVFLVLAAIVLMNLLVGVAVSDINDLEVLGNVRRLAKQAEFLGTLDILVYNRVFKILLPKRANDKIKHKRRVAGVLCLRPGTPRWRMSKMLPTRIINTIFDIAQKQKQQQDNEIGFQMFNQKIDEMYEVITKKKEKKNDISGSLMSDDTFSRIKMRHDEIIQHLNTLEEGVGDVKDKMALTHDESSIDAVNTRLDRLSLEMEAIKQTLFRLENKFGV